MRETLTFYAACSVVDEFIPQLDQIYKSDRACSCASMRMLAHAEA